MGPEKTHTDPAEGVVKNSRLHDLREKIMQNANSTRTYSKEYGLRLSRAGSHFTVHLLQGLEVGMKIGTTAGLILGSALAVIPQLSVAAPVLSKAIIPLAGGAGGLIGASAITLASIKPIWSELRGNPVPITGIKLPGYSMPDMFKYVLGKVMENEKGEKLKKDSPDAAAEPSKASGPIIKVRTDFGTVADGSLHLDPYERGHMIEMMVPDYIEMLRLSDRGGIDTLISPQRTQLEILSPGLCTRLDALFSADPDLVLAASRTQRGLNALIHSESIEDVKALTHLSSQVWIQAARGEPATLSKGMQEAMQAQTKIHGESVPPRATERSDLVRRLMRR